MAKKKKQIVVKWPLGILYIQNESKAWTCLGVTLIGNSYGQYNFHVLLY